MSFQPVLPMSGFGGWAFLNRTLEKQQDTFARSPKLQRDTDYFRENIAKVATAADLVADRRMLRVALGAFGLEGDIDNRAFLRKVLEDGTLDPKSLANRLADKRYLEFAKTFGFGENAIPLSQQEEGFGDRLASAYLKRQFEVAVGEQDQTMRLALAARRDLADLAQRDSSERALWFSVLGNPPLRQVFETAFNLPRSFGSIDLDQQVKVMGARARAAFGEGGVAQFRDPAQIEKLVRRFIVGAELQAAPRVDAGASSVALQLIMLGQSRS